MREHFVRLGDTGEKILRAIAPVGPARVYRDRVTSEVSGTGEKLKLTVYSKSPHRHLVEKGRKPGKMPPPAKLAKLMQIPKDEAFLVARRIARRGTRGHHTIDKLKKVMQPEVASTGSAILRDLKRKVES